MEGPTHLYLQGLLTALEGSSEVDELGFKYCNIPSVYNYSLYEK